MSEKFLRIIRDYTKNDFENFIQKHGLGEFQETFRENNIENGSIFLELNELKMLKLGLPAKSRKKIWSFVEDVQKFPEKFLPQSEKPKRDNTLMRRASFNRARMSFRQQLETVIQPSVVPSSDPKPILKPKPHLRLAVSPPALEYLDMTQNRIDNTITSNDEENGGYLTPTINMLGEDDIYEPPPSVIPKRDPLPLPKRSVDNTVIDYINGLSVSSYDEEAPPLLPRLQNAKRKDKKIEDEGDAEYIDPDETCPTIKNPPNNSPITQSPTTTSFISGLFKRGKKNETTTLKETQGDQSPEKEKIFEKNGNPQSRPLPPVPNEDDKKTLKSNDNTISKSFKEVANIHLRLDNPNSIDDNEVSYDNIDPKTNNYQFHSIKKLKLPAPPLGLPQVELANFDFRCEEAQNNLMNFNNNPYYRNTDRKGARLLLSDLDDGAFLFRPSKKFFLTLSVIYNGKDFHLGIQQMPNKTFCLNTEGDHTSPEFKTLIEFVQHFSREPLTFEYEGHLIESILKKILPHDRY